MSLRRIRKKARYQELLDKEAKYEELKQATDLNLRRREHVLRFVSVLSCALNSKELPAAETDMIDQIIPNPSAFVCQVDGVQQPLNGSSSSIVQALGDVLRINVGSQSLGAMKVGVVGDSAGVAVNEAGGGFVAVTYGSERMESDAILKFRFQSDSDILMSVGWTSLSTHPCSGGVSDERHQSTATTSSGKSDNLGFQMSYPSVVSLDPTHTSPDARQNEASEGDCTHGPGMSI